MCEFVGKNAVSHLTSEGVGVQEKLLQFFPLDHFSITDPDDKLAIGFFSDTPQLVDAYA